MVTALIIFAISIVVVSFVCWLLLLLVDYAKPPEPFGRVAKAFILVIGVIIVLYLLLGLVGAVPGPIVIVR